MKGSILDLFFLGFMAFGLILTSFIIFRVATLANTTCFDVAASIGADSNSTIACDQVTQATGNFAGILPFVLFILGLVSVALASLVPVSPIFLPVGIILWLIAVIIYVNVQTIVPSLLADAFIAPAATAYPLSAGFMTYVGWFVLIIGAALLIVMFGKGRGSSGTPEG